MSQHVDEFARRRRAKFAKVDKTPPRRQCFRDYWREINKLAGFAKLPRVVAREVALRWYHDRKRAGTLATAAEELQ